MGEVKGVPGFRVAKLEVVAVDAEGVGVVLEADGPVGGAPNADDRD